MHSPGYRAPACKTMEAQRHSSLCCIERIEQSALQSPWVQQRYRLMFQRADGYWRFGGRRDMTCQQNGTQWGASRMMLKHIPLLSPAAAMHGRRRRGAQQRLVCRPTDKDAPAGAHQRHFAVCPGSCGADDGCVYVKLCLEGAAALGKQGELQRWVPHCLRQTPACGPRSWLLIHLGRGDRSLSAARPLGTRAIAVAPAVIDLPAKSPPGLHHRITASLSGRTAQAGLPC